MTDLREKTIVELVKLHDASVPEDRRIVKWRKDRRKAELIELVERVLDDAEEPSGDPEPASNSPDLSGCVTVKEAAIRLLTHVDRVEGGRKIGLSYDAMVAAIRAHFPDAKTSPRSMAWYRYRFVSRDPAYTMGVEKLVVPDLPRGPGKKANG